MGRRPRRGHLSIPLWFDWGFCAPTPLTAGVTTFNPTLVRLGALCVVVCCLIPIAFNPTLVRLGGDCPDYLDPRPGPLSLPLWFDWGLARRGGRPGGPGFQSHSGSIGGVPGLALHVSSHDFQSHSGSIGGTWAQAPKALPPPTFNPTLVRLGAATLPASTPPVSSFQSHSGSIGGLADGQSVEFRILLSIPLWFDWG